MIHCHNCLQEIKEGEPYRKVSYWGSKIPANKLIYIHYPHCPEGADPCAHYEQNVLLGKSTYNFVPEAKYVKEV